MLLVLLLSTAVLGFGIDISEDVVTGGGPRREHTNYCRWAQSSWENKRCSVKDYPSCANCRYGWKEKGDWDHECCGGHNYASCTCPVKKNGYFSRHAEQSEAVVVDDSAAVALDDLIIYGFAAVGMVAVVLGGYRAVFQRKAEEEQYVFSQEA